jgi:hypothetical protein
VLEDMLTGLVSRAVRIVEVDLYALDGAQRETVLDALVTGTESPFMLVGESIACAGPLDLDAIAGALREA